MDKLYFFSKKIRATALAVLLAGICTSAVQAQLTQSNLPILVVETEGGAYILNEPKVQAHLGIIWNGDGAVNHLADPYNHYDGDIGIEIRGSSSQGFPKNNFAMETRNPDSTSLNVSLLGFPEENDWILSGPYTDKSLMRDALAYTLGGWIMDYAPRVKFCELVVNGDYRGVYMFTEKIKQDAGRVNISNLTPDENSGDDLTGGYIIKFDKFDGAVSDGFASQYHPYPGAAGFPVYQYHDPKPDEITPEQRNYIQGYINEFEDVMWSQDFADSLNGYRKYLDVPSVLHFIFIQEISRNVDGYRLSTFMYKDKDSKDSRLHLGPVWDFNLGFGNVDYCTGPGTTGWALDFNDVCPGDYWVIHFWWEKLRQDPAFVKEMKEEWLALRQTTLSNDRIFHLVDSLGTLLAGPAQRNFLRWPILTEYVWPNAFIGGSYPSEVNYVRSWLTNRLAWLDAQFDTTTEVVITPPVSPLPGVLPNPFRNEISFWCQGYQLQHLRVDIFNAEGRLVTQLSETVAKSGPKELIWSPGSDVPPGVYFYKVWSGKTRAGSGQMVKY